MNRERVKLLVEALRTTTHKQTKYKLKNGDAYCTSGIACNIYNESTGLSGWKKDIWVAKSGDRVELSVPHQVVFWWGTDNLFIDIVRWNDDKHFSFCDIASMIEEKYLKVKENNATDG